MVEHVGGIKGKEIDTLVFDLGRVLIHWDPYGYMVGEFGEDVAKRLVERVFSAPEWNLMDKGDISESQLWRMMEERYPEDARYIHHMKNAVLNLLKPIEENTRLLPILKAHGYRLCVLSNFSYKAFEYVYNTFDFFKHFDCMVISSHVRKIKPNEDIFYELMGRCGVRPSNSLFIDDRADNIETARRLGFHVIHLVEHGKLKEELEKILGINLG
ncbi:HAD family hydrolase [Fervidobacterium sp.]